MSLKGFIRTFLIKRNRCTAPTRIMPLSAVNCAVTFISADDPELDKCRDTIQQWYRQHGIRGEIFFMDFRKLIDQERLTTSINNTVIRKDIDWLGRPSADKLRTLDSLQADMIIVLPRFEDNYPMDYLISCCHAGCRVGRKGDGEGIYDIQIEAGEGMTQLEFFKAVTSWLEKIK